MLLRYFGFNDDPFGSTPDPRYLFASPTHREALASLQYGFLNNRGFTALIAPPGMGKTTLLFRFLEGIQESARSVFLIGVDKQCEPRELVGYILRDLGITPGQSGAEMHDQLAGVLVGEARAGRRVVIVIDEAQNLSDSALEMVRLLTNFETPRAKLMQVVLAGQPQLSDTLMQPALVQLRQRISTICRIEPLSPRETRAYIEHRLKFAGYRGGPLFTEEALDLVMEASQGTPRMINNLCFSALSLCCALNAKRVDRSMIAEVVSDQRLVPPAPLQVAAGQPAKPVRRTRAARYAAFLVPSIALLFLAVFAAESWLSNHWIHPSQATGGARSSNPATSTLAASVPVSATRTSGKPIVAAATPSLAPIETTVGPHQTPKHIAARYPGKSDIQRLLQLLVLNPTLIDPNHIEPGARARLPPGTSQTDTSTSSADKRNIP